MKNRAEWKKKGRKKNNVYLLRSDNRAARGRSLKKRTKQATPPACPLMHSIRLQISLASFRLSLSLDSLDSSDKRPLQAGRNRNSRIHTHKWTGYRSLLSSTLHVSALHCAWCLYSPPFMPLVLFNKAVAVSDPPSLFSKLAACFSPQEVFVTPPATSLHSANPTNKHTNQILKQ